MIDWYCDRDNSEALLGRGNITQRHYRIQYRPFRYCQQDSLSGSEWLLFVDNEFKGSYEWLSMAIADCEAHEPFSVWLTKHAKEFNWPEEQIDIELRAIGFDQGSST
jgi:hypothetical protein